MTARTAAVVLAAAMAGEVGVAGPPKRADLLTRALAGPLKGVEEIVFAVRSPGRDGHWYANFGYWTDDVGRMMCGAGGGRLCKLNLRSGQVTTLLDDPRGAVRDPHVHYEGRTVVFSYRPGGGRHYNLYEIRADGTGLKQLTSGPWDDIEPTYLPTGQILFCSSRCKRWVPCYQTQVAILHRCEADGSDIRRMSANVEHDNTPAVLGDGRILFTRWEYVDRSELCFHHLWTMNPDGTGQMVYFGNMHPSTVLIDARPIGGSRRIVCVVSPGHGRTEHAGRLAVIDGDAGPDEKGSLKYVGKGGEWRDPWPLSEGCFLAAETDRKRTRSNLTLIDEGGATQVLYSIPTGRQGPWLHEPRPLRPRRREPLVASHVDWSQPTGRLMLTDAARGRKMAGVRRGEVEKLLVLEVLPKPVGFGGVPHALSWWGTLNLERVVGTVAVEPDGSAYFELPALRSFFFVALDGRGETVKRMQSFVSVMPGEVTGCAGCHERRVRTARNRGTAAGAIGGQATPLAMSRPASRIEPIDDVPDVLDFPRDIQPILDRHCVRCHGGGRRSGGVVLTGGRGPIYSHSYWTLLVRKQIADGQNGLGNRPPRSIGASASELMRKIEPRLAEGGKTHNEVKLTPLERRTVRMWIESGAAYAGTYAALGTGKLFAGDIFLDFTLKGRLGKLMSPRCGRCHRGRRELQAKPVRGRYHVRTVRPADPIIRFSEHLIFDFTEPGKSLALLAPLAREAGGYGVCRKIGRDGKLGAAAKVLGGRDDPTFRAMLAAIREGKAELDRITRFDMPNFRPSADYVREMKRFGILPAGLDPARRPIDVYRTDQAYWRSLWHRPIVSGR